MFIKNTMSLSTVVYSGKMTRSSGVLDLLDAISISNGQWVLAISGPLKEFSSRHIDIQYEISKRGLSNEVFYLGYLSKCDYKRLISSADVLVVPKTDEAINVGNMPGKLAEFLMAGRPVVAANIGDISMYVRDCEDVLLYDAGDISDLESKISLFLKDHEFSHKVGFSGRRAAILSFGNVKLMERLYSFLNKL